jgi:oligoribonuclease (3'-5' exoribonuclease)
MNIRKICIYDFETDGVNEKICNPVQLAALMIDGKKLTIIPDSEFVINIQPPDILDLKKYLTKEKSDTISWHAKNYKTTSEEIIKKWQESMDEKTAWDMFLQYFNKYNPKGGVYAAPMLGGMNIRNFDNVIIQRLMSKYNTKPFYWRRDVADLLDWCFMWFESLEEPKAYNLDELRRFFGISLEGGHDALKDVRDSADLIIRFLKLTRRYASKVNFKGACSIKEI